MKDILSRANRDVLASFARTRVLLAFDFDGTLAPIVRDPARAVMRPATRRRLTRLARLYPCVVISGRRADVLRRVGRTGVRTVIGDHGIVILSIMMRGNGSAWDYGSLGYEAAGNYNYAVAMKATGIFSENTIRRISGKEQKTEKGPGNPGYIFWGGTYPYGDHFDDQEAIGQAFDYVNCTP